MRFVTRPASRRMRRWCEKVDLLSSRPASCMTWAHHDSPLRARKRTDASRCGSASAASTFGSSMSSTAGSTTSSITRSSIGQSCEEFDTCRTVRSGSNTLLLRVLRSVVTDTASEPGSRRWLMLPVVLLAMFKAGFDIWGGNVAAPALQRDLHGSDAALQLIVGGYAFMYASGMVTGGRLGDLVGYRRMFMIGVASFAVA